MVSGLTKRLFSVGEWINGWNVFERLDQFHEMERWDPGRIEEFKLDNLKRLAHSAYIHVPLYRQLWDKAGVHPNDIKDLDDLSGFPIITKQMLREAGDLALDDRYPKKKLRKVRTTGSTGEPLTIYKDRAHQSWFIAGVFLGLKWAGWEPGDCIMAHRERKPAFKEKIENLVFNYKRIPYPQLDEAYYRKFIKQAISFQSVVLRSFPFPLYCTARRLLAEQVYSIRPKAVCSTGDLLYPSYRKVIEQAFGCRVYDSYGTAEMIVAHQCEKGSLHIIPSGYVEVDRERQGLVDTEPRRILLTSLTNYAMPLIRYSIADMGSMGGDTCACGRTWKRLSTLYGRDTDIIITPSGKYLFWPHFDVLFRSFEGVDRFQAVQEEIGEIRLHLVTNQSYSREIHEPMVVDSLSKIGGPGLDIEITYVDSIPIPASGKYRYIISKVTAPPR